MLMDVAAYQCETKLSNSKTEHLQEGSPSKKPQDVLMVQRVHGAHLRCTKSVAHKSDHACLSLRTGCKESCKKH